MTQGCQQFPPLVLNQSRDTEVGQPFPFKIARFSLSPSFPPLLKPLSTTNSEEQIEELFLCRPSLMPATVHSI